MTMDYNEARFKLAAFRMQVQDNSREARIIDEMQDVLNTLESAEQDSRTMREIVEGA